MYHTHTHIYIYIYIYIHICVCVCTASLIDTFPSKWYRLGLSQSGKARNFAARYQHFKSQYYGVDIYIKSILDTYICMIDPLCTDTRPPL